MSGRRAFLSIDAPHVTISPSVAFYVHDGGEPVAVVNLGEFKMQVYDAAQAREMANAFAKAAELLEATP